MMSHIRSVAAELPAFSAMALFLYAFGAWTGFWS